LPFVEGGAFKNAAIRFNDFAGSNIRVMTGDEQLRKSVAQGKIEIQIDRLRSTVLRCGRLGLRGWTSRSAAARGAILAPVVMWALLCAVRIASWQGGERAA
jgi:hypothetical protein